MPTESRIVQPGKIAGTVRTDRGETLSPPPGWALLPPGDAALTRKVKALGPSWSIQVKKGRKLFSQGVYADAANIDSARRQLTELRESAAYQRSRASAGLRRERKQETYEAEFFNETVRFLAFHPHYRELGEKLARAVTELAVPIGSGTVARTERIPLAARVEAAVIAWLRHQTTAYDRMRVERVKGRRREIRRGLARQSVELLEGYRRGQVADASILAAALADLAEPENISDSLSADQGQ